MVQGYSAMKIEQFQKIRLGREPAQKLYLLTGKLEPLNTKPLNLEPLNLEP